MSENIKGQVRKLEILSDARQHELDLELKARIAAEENDFKRDQLIQDRMIELKKIGEEKLNNMIELAQAANDDDKEGTRGTRSGGQTASSQQ